MNTPYILTVLFFLGLFLVVFFQIRKHHEEELETIEAVLDAVLNKEYPSDISMYREGQENKLIYKALRVAAANRIYRDEALREKNKLQELMADVTHQMRTPIASMRMFLELMQSGGLSEAESKEFLERMRFDSQRLSWLVDEFLKMANFETQLIQVKKTDEEIDKTIEQAILQSTAQLQEKAQDSRILFNHTDLRVFHDRKWTSEAISNVLDNALKYASADSKIKISVDQLISYTRISISNYGKTISNEELSQLFVKYFRGSSYQNEIEGFGIGLYLTKLIFEAQDGYVLADSKDGLTVFSLFLQN